MGEDGSAGERAVVFDTLSPDRQLVEGEGQMVGTCIAQGYSVTIRNEHMRLKIHIHTQDKYSRHL